MKRNYFIVTSVLALLMGFSAAYAQEPVVQNISNIQELNSVLFNQSEGKTIANVIADFTGDNIIHADGKTYPIKQVMNNNIELNGNYHTLSTDTNGKNQVFGINIGGDDKYVVIKNFGQADENGNIIKSGFDNFYDTYGSAVTFAAFAKGSITDSVFTNNSAKQRGGAVAVTNYADVDEVAGVFQNNSAGRGGAIYVASKSHIGLIDGIFSGNYASSDGGAIYNVYEDGLGGLIDKITGIYKGNTTGGNGGAISNTATISAIDAYFEDNNAKIMGGAIANDTNFITEIKGTFINNSTGAEGSIAEFGGGAIFNHDGYITLIDGVFKGNHTTNAGGGAIGNNADRDDRPGKITAIKGEFTGN